MGGARRIAAADRRAAALGLHPGLALADARAREPGLVVAEYEPGEDEALLARMAEDCDRWTPLVAHDPPHGLILDVTGCAHLFGGEAALRERITARFARGRFEVLSALAGTPEAARALARFGPGGITAPGAEEAAARPLPVAALEAPAETLLALSRAGLKRVGDLADRPSRPLAARFGQDLTVRLARLLGWEDRRITPIRPPPGYLVEQPFADPIGDREDVERCLRRLTDRMALMLEERGEGGRIFEASFFRTDGAVRRVRVATGRPSRDPQAIRRLMAEKLDALADPLDPGFGFDLIRLSAPRAEPLANLQPDLDGAAVEEDEVADLIDRLAARLGPERVSRLAPVDTHLPERAGREVPALAGEPARQWPAQEPGEPPLRPLRLFDPPQPVEAIAELPDGPPARFRWRRVVHDVARAEGPERIAPEWWRDKDAPTRDYYRVEDARGRRFWLFRAGLYER
ncbi:MAG: DNA polymerase Y family protein, partial [Salinarimonadaceae bacterium]